MFTLKILLFFINLKIIYPLKPMNQKHIQKLYFEQTAS